MNTAQISTDGTHQIVILPEGFKMSGTEVYIKKVGSAIVLIRPDSDIDVMVQFHPDAHPTFRTLDQMEVSFKPSSVALAWAIARIETLT